MRIQRIYSYNECELNKSDIDICIVASGYESRARYLANEFSKKKINIRHKYVWGFHEHNNEKIRLKNNKELKKLGYELKEFSGSDSAAPNEVISNIILQSNSAQNKITMLIDISSMSRTWYGAIIKTLSQIDLDKPVQTIFAYVPAVWENDTVYPPNEILAPLPGYSSHELPNKPTALIIGLGQEKGRALGLKEHLDPQALTCFYTSPGIDPRYEEHVLEANKDLLDNLNQNDIYTYDIINTYGTYKILESVCNGLMRDYRIVLASLGPKIFGIYCLLLATAKPNISVWRVSPAAKQEPVDQKPSKEKIFFAVDWYSK